MTKNNQCKNLIELSKVFALGFRMQVGTSFRTRDTNLKTKVRPVTQTVKPNAVIQFSNLDLTLLGPFKSEPLK